MATSLCITILCILLITSSAAHDETGGLAVSNLSVPCDGGKACPHLTLSRPYFEWDFTGYVWFARMNDYQPLNESAFVKPTENVTNNPADELVAIVNSNRTAHKASSLGNNPGLACIALQYIKAYQGNCDDVGKSKKPADSEFADTFAPKCGVELPTLAPITGRVLGCQSKYVNPDKAFTEILTMKNRSLNIIYNTTYTEVGAAVSGSDGGGPYFWCLLFSNGKSNSSFLLEGGTAKITSPGCFSGANDDCSGAYGWSQNLNILFIFAGVFAVICYTIGV